MNERPTREELQERIEGEIAHFGGAMPERVALVWDGYFAALLEWNLITPADHRALSSLLPAIPDNPVTAIFLGRERP
jgi:hypothetical protein